MDGLDSESVFYYNWGIFESIRFITLSFWLSFKSEFWFGISLSKTELVSFYPDYIPFFSSIDFSCDGIILFS